jgi:hypothetical protein
MNNVYRVSGRYLAKYPDGKHSGKIGIGATVLAKDEKEAQKLVANRTIATYGYIGFTWETVSVLRQQA